LELQPVGFISFSILLFNLRIPWTYARLSG